MSAARTNAERSSASPTYDLNRSPSRNLPGRPMAPSLLESRCAPGSLLLPVRRLRLSRTCVILNGHIWSLTWADVDTAHLMFWRHGAVRRGADARARRSIDAQTDITLPTSLGLSGYIFSAPCGVSAGHEPFSGDTPTQVRTNRVICAGQWWRRLAADPYRLIVISPS